MTSLPSPRPTGRRPGLLYRTTNVLLHVLGKLYFRWQVHHPEHVPRTGPVLLAANHVSFLDPPFIGAAVPRPIHFLARSTLFSNPLLGAVIRRLQALPIDREAGGTGLKAILELLGQGEAILLFPEGTRSPDGRLIRAKAGIGLTVMKTDAVVVPVRIVGAFESWGRHQKWPRPHRLEVHFGPPIDLTALRQEAETCDKARLKEIYQETADVIMAGIGALPATVR
jgi:1-acyl-sn-glycerol-3-phosphate acyltransferase